MGFFCCIDFSDMVFYDVDFKGVFFFCFGCVDDGFCLDLINFGGWGEYYYFFKVGVVFYF